MNGTDNQVMVIVVTYNREALLERCLKALVSQTVELAYICIVDNASTDDTENLVADYQKRYQKQICYQRLEKNLGGAGGFCSGFRYAMEIPDWDWLMVMDDDAAPCPDYTEKLLRAAEAYPLVKGYIGTEYVGYTEQRAYGGRRIIEKQRTFGEKIVAQEKYQEPSFFVDIVTFVGFMLHRSVVEKVGFPDDTLFIYYDDTDYCIRVRKYTKILHVTDAKIVHRENFEKDVLINGKKEWRRYYLYRNELVIRKRYISSFFLRYAWIGRACLRRTAQILREDDDKSRKIILTLRATFDVLCNKLGRADYIHYD